jgi:glycosyltransferase involved in cell wall biosynthesis
MLTVAVLLPVRNEGPFLERTLASLAGQTEPAERLMVVDGGSEDETLVKVQKSGATFLLHPQGGRGGQIAAGIACTTEDVVVIGHGDMVFPPTAFARLRAYLLANPACPGGCFGHCFASPRWRYRLLEWCDRQRGKRGISYGDQAQFFRRKVLEQAGGFPNQPMMEDVEVVERLRPYGALAYLDVPVIVSPRRFERHGWFRTTWENWWFRRAYRLHGQKACKMIFERYYRKDGTGNPPLAASGR